MPARASRKLPSPVVIAGEPPIAAIEGALQLLTLFKGVDADKAGRTLKAMQKASKANSEAVAAFGPLNQIKKLHAETEGLRQVAVDAVADARKEAERIVTEAEAGLAEQRRQIENERKQLDEEREALAVRVQAQDDREAAYEREVVGLRRVLG